MVDPVVVHAIADAEHRLAERRGPGELEAHALVTGHVDDEAARGVKTKVVVGNEHQRRVGVLQDAVDDDVLLGEELRHRHRTGAPQHLRPGGVFAHPLELAQQDRGDR